MVPAAESKIPPATAESVPVRLSCWVRLLFAAVPDEVTAPVPLLPRYTHTASPYGLDPAPLLEMVPLPATCGAAAHMFA